MNLPCKLVSRVLTPFLLVDINIIIDKKVSQADSCLECVVRDSASFHKHLCSVFDQFRPVDKKRYSTSQKKPLRSLLKTLKLPMAKCPDEKFNYGEILLQKHTLAAKCFSALYTTDEMLYCVMP